MSKLELERTRICSREAAESLSGAEFYIRVGWAKGDVPDLLGKVDDFVGGAAEEAVIDIPEADPHQENPMKPR